ncbi:MmcQ/YjbR family DNA-binding protein [Actinomadura craniellae]|uniref:MmcQ/YjbR family DNA-binding protein n=1 Tax=Actinomadura craniellae TaxID=2231787 RepID=UPI001F2A6D50|nr:MmcQ/YjbR family DNA-binding protein [Actinomadura craniellae]
MSADEFLQIVLALPEVRQKEHTNWTGFNVAGKGFGYLSEDGETAMLKATLVEQAAMVGENPEAFARSYTSEQYGWVEVRLGAVPRDELEEVITEAWYLTAPQRLTDAYDLPA